VDSRSLRGHLRLFQRDRSKRSTSLNSSTDSTFVFTHADVVDLRVQYHAPTTWHYRKANSEQRRETIHFRLTADGVQPAFGSFQVDLTDAVATPEPIQNGGNDHVTVAGNRSTLIAAAVTSGLAVTAAVVAVVGIVVTVFWRRRRREKVERSGVEKRLPPRDTSRPGGEVQLPEVVLISVSNLPPDYSSAPAGAVRQPIGVDWSNVDPEILQHCRTTDPILDSTKVWV